METSFTSLRTSILPLGFFPPLPSAFPPDLMRQLRFRVLHLLLLLVSLLFYMKVRRVANIQAFLSEQSHLLDNRQKLEEYGQLFREAFSKSSKSGPPAILLLNKFALNISLNFICNLRKFPDASGRLLAVTFDSYSHDVLKESFPEVGLVHWHLPALEGRFSSGERGYQLFQLFRAKLASFLTGILPSFWMVQADTIWREDLFGIINLDSGEYANADLVFDSEGPEGLLQSMIAGGYFFVRSSNRTKNFFDSVAQFLLDHFATDNNVMTRLCILALYGNKCSKIPYSTISNWRRSGQEGMASGGAPSLFQFDGGDGAGNKFEKMQAQGHIFVDPVTLPRENGLQQSANCLPEGGRGEWKEGKRANHLMAFVHSTFELVHARYPPLKDFLLSELFPYYAAYLFI